MIFNFAVKTCFSSGIPVVGVYLVKPSSKARLAAALIGSGVSKSGWPAAKLIMFLPAATNCLARALIANVAEGTKLTAALENIRGFYSSINLFYRLSFCTGQELSVHQWW